MILAATDHRSQRNACRTTRAYRVSRVTAVTHIIRNAFAHIKTIRHAMVIIKCYAIRHNVFDRFISNAIYQTLNKCVHNVMLRQYIAHNAQYSYRKSNTYEEKGVKSNGL